MKWACVKMGLRENDQYGFYVVCVEDVYGAKYCATEEELGSGPL